mmetsp:Transcript_40197/g.45745  ORF Transcript_40197/g.45745 Transcript_40197/m.45745 type:complete len:641 (-) Transcript_40197:176-2098(-)|eukprot:CAMPEP_0194153452 /NCGR_PEP_ID=MMETSP0152-20130528/56464_1 /TAXON_ID=1049557 /ORGANISM="Thalassiothrix antarctica, Strain L6-D1" /LENGTH=640 /DNA_ID=CAMNT_0038858749 /DNA_START=28 /DNA_END=1950 /DNA_ORIENTATION=-
MMSSTNRRTKDSNNGFAYIESVQTTKQKKQILYPMKVDFPEGSICAILGPSGSGKTTFLNTITDNIQINLKSHGQVHLPGTTAFVPQDDRLHGFYTCRSYLKHYARLSGTRITPAINNEIDDLLKGLGLFGQADTIVGDVFLKGLSGGQKRRLSVALEALTHPQNFFLDEPTSGLDSESAYQVMEFLAKYVRAAPGRRVILTIHQPSSHIWNSIDYAVLLSKGRLIYQGPRLKMENFFAFAGYPTPSNFNPADHYVTVVNDEFRLHELSVTEWAEKFSQYSINLTEDREEASSMASQNHNNNKMAVITRRSRSPLIAVIELINRYFLNLWFNPGILGTRIAMYAMLAGMVGGLFWQLGDRSDFESVQSRAAVLFYCVAFFIFMSVAVLPFTVIERAIVDKEVRNGYYPSFAYQLSQAVASIPGCGILAGLTTLIIVLMLDLNEPYWYLLTMFLSLLNAEALAMLVSHVVPHFIIGMAILAGLYGFFMLFMGFMITPSNFPSWLRWTNDIAFHTYSWRTFMHHEFCCSDDTTYEGPYSNGEDVLEAYEIGDVDPQFDMIVLALYSLALHLLSLVVLYLRYNAFKGRLLQPTNTMASASANNVKNMELTQNTYTPANPRQEQTAILPQQTIMSLPVQKLIYE